MQRKCFLHIIKKKHLRDTTRAIIQDYLRLSVVSNLKLEFKLVLSILKFSYEKVPFS